MIQEQIVYLPIKENSVFKILENGITLQNCYPEEGYFFTPEELNEYTSNIGKAFLENAAEKAELDYWGGSCRECGENKINEKSITDTFEETFKKFKV